MEFSQFLTLKWLKKIGQILIKQEQNVIFIKGPNFFPRWQHILANIAGLSWKELAALVLLPCLHDVIPRSCIAAGLQDTHHTHTGGGGAGVTNTGVCLGKDYYRPTNFRDPETWGVVKF